MGDDFPRERFVRTPVAVIRWALREIDNYNQEKANISAVTTSHLVVTLIQIAHGFSGSKRPAPKVKAQDFLPYPEWTGLDKNMDGPDEYTRLVLAQLGRQRALPLHVLAALITPPPRGS